MKSYVPVMMYTFVNTFFGKIVEFQNFRIQKLKTVITVSVWCVSIYLMLFYCNRIDFTYKDILEMRFTKLCFMTSITLNYNNPKLNWNLNNSNLNLSSTQRKN